MTRKNETSSTNKVNSSGDKFAASYPNIVRFIKEHEGWVEIGRDEYSRSLVRAVNGGGLVWEGETDYTTMDEAMRALEAGVATWWED